MKRVDWTLQRTVAGVWHPRIKTTSAPVALVEIHRKERGVDMIPALFSRFDALARLLRAQG